MPIVALAAHLLLVPTATSAAGYNDTNPATTPCGDGSHPIAKGQQRWISNGAGLKIALLEVRKSDFCNTVWTRITNESGRGAGYAPAQTITATSRTYVYTCTLSTCVEPHAVSTDTLKPYGVSPYQGWAHQLVIPAGSNLGAPPAKQPPSFRGTAIIVYAGTTYVSDVGIEPVYTQFSNAMGSATEPWSCDNTLNHECKSWGTPGGTFRTIYARLDPSLSGSVGSPDLGSDFEDIVRPLWNAAWTHNPLVLMCTSCSEQILVKLAPLQQGWYSSTEDNSNEPGIPEIMVHRTIVLATAVTWDHICGTTDVGCTTSSPGFGCDARVCISHEMGHAQGLGHCPHDWSVMCSSNQAVHGTAFWTPQASELLGLKVLYP